MHIYALIVTSIHYDTVGVMVCHGESWCAEYDYFPFFNTFIFCLQYNSPELSVLVNHSTTKILTYSVKGLNHIQRADFRRLLKRRRKKTDGLFVCLIRLPVASMALCYVMILTS